MPKAPKPTAARKLNPALAKPLTPSPELAAVVGAEPLPRTTAVARLWDHIKANGLQDPADRRSIVADDALRPIIGERCTMFQLAGLIGPHLTAA